MAVFTFETVGALDCFDFLTFSFSSVALNGYAYSKKYFSSTVWKIFYVAYLFWLIFYLIIAAYILKIPQLGEVAVLDFWVSIDLVLSVLSLTAIYLYAYKSVTVWKS